MIQRKNRMQPQAVSIRAHFCQCQESHEIVIIRAPRSGVKSPVVSSNEPIAA
jgi:hypothetical protein